MYVYIVIWRNHASEILKTTNILRCLLPLHDSDKRSLGTKLTEVRTEFSMVISILNAIFCIEYRVIWSLHLHSVKYISSSYVFLKLTIFSLFSHHQWNALYIVYLAIFVIICLWVTSAAHSWFIIRSEQGSKLSKSSDEIVSKSILRNANKDVPTVPSGAFLLIMFKVE